MLFRSSEDWKLIKEKHWENAFEEAEDLANYDQELHIIGSDIDHQMIDIAKDNAMEAGLADLISWKQMQVKDLFIREEKGYLVTNPPYGERLSDTEAVTQLYKDLGTIMIDHPSWSIYILTAFKGFENQFGRKATRKRKLFNGFIEANYYQYFGQRK